jgi:hypothetical protein
MSRIVIVILIHHRHKPIDLIISLCAARNSHPSLCSPRGLVPAVFFLSVVTRPYRAVYPSAQFVIEWFRHV